MENSDINVLFLNPAPSLIKYGMYWGAKKIGCNAYLLTSESERVFTENHEEQYRRIERAINRYNINIIFCEGYGNMNARGIISLCKKYNIQYHHWAIEDPVTPRLGESFAKVADFMWTTTKEFVSKYQKLGCDSDLLLFGCNPDISRAKPEKRFEAGVSIVGSNYDNRWRKAKEFVLPLLEDEFNPALYGFWWMAENQPFKIQDYGKEKYYWKVKEGHNDEVLPFEWLPIVVNSSKIMIGLNCSSDSVTQTSCRPYETLSCAYEDVVYLAWYTEAQNRIFGDHIYQARTGEEMVKMARMILRLPKETRLEKARKAREFVHNNHSYEKRFRQVADKFKEIYYGRKNN